MKSKMSTRTLAVTAMFAAISTVLSYIEVPLPFMPPFLKFDISTIPVLIGSFMMGPDSAVIMAFIKNFVRFLTTDSGGVGQIADFIITTVFAVTASLIYRRNKTKKGAVLACVGGVVAIAIAGVLANKFILLPFYSQMMPMETIFELCGNVNPLIHDTNSYLLFGALPFNMVKGIIISLITFPIYKKLSIHIKKFISDGEAGKAVKCAANDGKTSTESK